MKQPKTLSFAIRSSLVLSVALAFAVAFWSPVQAQKTEPTAGKMEMEGKMMEHCQEMKAQKQKMMEAMKGQDAELTELVAEMNSAPADKKVDVIAAAVTHMVEQRIAMDAQKATMQEEMMAHMMEHMQMGNDSMAQCPMMKGMKDMSEKQAGTREVHHDEQK